MKLLKRGVKSSITVSRLQFPLVPAMAITDYKCQGETYKAAIVDLAQSLCTNKGLFGKREKEGKGRKK